MSTEHALETINLSLEPLTTEIEKPEIPETDSTDEEAPEEVLYFWSEPGVCG